MAVAEDEMNAEQIEMIEKFQCPGCTCGGDHDCGTFKYKEEETGCLCSGHSAGTFIGGAGKIALGMPVVFL